MERKTGLHTLRLLLLTLVLALSPALAHANTGTALMWVPVLHLTIVNIIVTFIEAGLIRRVFKMPFGASQISMGVANYVSAFTGFWLVGFARGPFEQLLLRDLHHASLYFWTAWFLVFIGSLLVEYPFFYILFRKSERRWPRSVKALFVANSVSYAILIFIYVGVSTHGILTVTKIERSPFFAKVPHAIVYFLSQDDDSVWRCRLDGEPAGKISHGADGPDLLPSPWRSTRKGSHDSWTERRGITDLRPENQRELEVMFGDFGDLCLNYGKPDERWLNKETPLVSCPMSDCTILPGDQLVMQVRDMIVLLDLHTLQMAVLAHGRAPVVVLE